MMVSGTGGREKWGFFCLIGTDFQFFKMKSVLEIGYTTM